jgi:Xaa-Pro aminopeptidase
MRDEGIETLCLTDEYNLQYFFGEEVSGYAFITQEDVKMVLPRFYRYEGLDYDIDYIFSGSDRDKALQKLEYGQVYADKPEKLEEYFETEKTDIVNDTRRFKTAEEVEKLRKASKLSHEAIRTLKPEMVGMTEFEAVNRLQKFYAKEGVTESFLTNGDQSLVQRNSMRPHRPPEKKKIKSEDLVIVDTGARYENYCGDVTRTFCESPSDRQVELFNDVKEIQSELIKEIEPGLKISEWVNHQFDLIKQRGYDLEKNLLYFSHNIGIEVHEPPTLTHESDQKFKEGMVFTVEPGLHIEGLGGVRLEDMVHLKSEGTEILGSSPRELN